MPYPEVTITPNGVTVVIKASELYLKLLKYGRYWKTYPEYKEKSVSVLTDEHGDFITDQDGIPLAIEETSEIAPGVLASIDRMMEILSKSQEFPLASSLKLSIDITCVGCAFLRQIP